MVKKTSLKKNFMFNIGYQILAVIMPLITAPYIARVLGADNGGIYSKTQAFAHYFLLFAMLGVNNYGNRAIARVRENKRDLSITFWEIYSFQMIMAVLSFLVYLVFCVFIVRENINIYLLQATYVFSGVLNINWCCFGLEKFKLTTIRSSVVKILSAICVFTFVKKPDDLWIYTIILGMSHVLSDLSVWPFVLKHVERVKPTWEGIKRHIKPNLILFWPVLAVSVYNIMDRIMLGWMSVDAEVAFYTYAERIITVPTTLILALDNVIMPRMSNLYAREGKNARIDYLMDNVMMFAMFMAAAMSFGVAGVADVFAPWFYGKEYIRCGYFLQLLSPVIIIKAWAGALRTQYIIPTGRDKIYVISLTTGAIVNVILNVALIPVLNGIGAIIGTLAAEFSVCFIQFYKCRKDINIKQYMLNGFSFCLIGAVMFIVIEAFSHVSNHAILTLLIQVLIGMVVYIFLSSIYMLKIRKNPVLINAGLKMLHIRYKFPENQKN